MDYWIQSCPLPPSAWESHASPHRMTRSHSRDQNFAPEVRREKRKSSSRNLANFTTPTFMLASSSSPKNQGNPETRGNLIKFDKMSGARASRMDESRRAQSARKAWITIPCKTSRLTCRWREKDTRRWHTGARFYLPGVND